MAYVYGIASRLRNIFHGRKRPDLSIADSTHRERLNTSRHTVSRNVALDSRPLATDPASLPLPSVSSGYITLYCVFRLAIRNTVHPKLRKRFKTCDHFHYVPSIDPQWNSIFMILYCPSVNSVSFVYAQIIRLIAEIISRYLGCNCLAFYIYLPNYWQVRQI